MASVQRLATARAAVLDSVQHIATTWDIGVRFSARSAQSQPSRLAAAKAVVAELGRGPAVAALLWRLGEFCGNVLLPCGMLWNLTPLVFWLCFFALWFVPAVCHNKSFWAPVRYPMINFVADDFSVLALHPHQRGVRGFYMVSVIRVLAMLLLYSLLNISEGGQNTWIETVLNKDFHVPAMDSLRDQRSLQVRWLWRCLASFVILCSLVWVFVTSIMLCCKTFRGRRTPFFQRRCDHLIDRVNDLASQVHAIVTAEDLTFEGAPGRCREALVRLRDDEYPTFKLETVAGTYGPAYACLLHWFTVCTNIVNCLQIGHYVYAGLFAVNLLATIAYGWMATTRGLHRICQEAKLSKDSGILSHDFLVILRMDKGCQMVPALLLQVYGLPFCMRSTIAALSAAVSIVTTIVFVVPFIYHDYDLGIEQEGMSQTRSAELSQLRHERLFSQLSTPAEASHFADQGQRNDSNNIVSYLTTTISARGPGTSFELEEIGPGTSFELEEIEAVEQIESVQGVSAFRSHDGTNA